MVELYIYGELSEVTAIQFKLADIFERMDEASVIHDIGHNGVIDDHVRLRHLTRLKENTDGR